MSFQNQFYFNEINEKIHWILIQRSIWISGNRTINFQLILICFLSSSLTQAYTWVSNSFFKWQKYSIILYFKVSLMFFWVWNIISKLKHVIHLKKIHNYIAKSEELQYFIQWYIIVELYPLNFILHIWRLVKVKHFSLKKLLEDQNIS